MTPRLGGAIAATLLALLGGGAAAGERDGARYLRRLQIPEAADRLKQPLAVHADLHTGEIFVCDRTGDRLVIFDATGLYRYQIRGGATFSTPLDVAVDPDGYIVVLGFVGGRVGLVVLDFDGRFLREIRLTGLPEGAPEPQPISIALSSGGEHLYVLDQAGPRLWIADRDGRVVGSTDLAAGLTPKEAREQILGHVDVYGDTVLVGMPMAGTVLLLGADGRPKGSVGLKGTAACQTAFPVAGALDRDGNVVVLDQQRTLMTVWRPSERRCLREFGGIGSLPGYLYQPADLAIDGAGRLYVGQGFDGRVQAFDFGVPAAGAP